MYSLMKWYRKYFKYSSGSSFYPSICLAVCKCIENEILAGLYFSSRCLNRQYRQISVTAKYMFYSSNMELLLLLLMMIMMIVVIKMHSSHLDVER